MAGGKRVLPSTREKAPSGDEYGKMVEVKGLVGFYSGYFAAALKDGFAESKQGFIELLDEDVDVFKRFATWLYTQRIELPQVSATSAAYSEIIALWTFADRRDIPLLMNEAINAAKDEHLRCWTVPLLELREVYRDTMPGSGLRRFMVHIVAAGGNEHIADHEGLFLLSHEALRDVLRSVWQLNEAKTGVVSFQDIEKMDLCEYHVHANGVRCSKV